MSEAETPTLESTQLPVLACRERTEDEGQVTRDVGQRDAGIATAKPVSSSHPPNFPSATPLLPCGEGAGDEGRSAAAVPQNEIACNDEKRARVCAPHPPAPSPRGGGGDERTAPLILWRIAQTFLHTLHALFGDPSRIAFQHTLTKEPHDLLLSWLRCGEAMMRRLLLIEAAAYPKPNTPPRLWPKRARKRKLVGFDDDKPETWRVSFRCFRGFNSSPARGGSGVRSTSKGAPEDCAQSPTAPSVSFADSSPASGGAVKFWEGAWFTAKPPKFYSAWPLAERYEALLRVFNDPAPYARRLAKRLHALKHRVVEILRAPPEAEHRIERFEALTHAAAARWRCPNTS